MRRSTPVALAMLVVAVITAACSSDESEPSASVEPEEGFEVLSPSTATEPSSTPAPSSGDPTATPAAPSTTPTATADQSTPESSATPVTATELPSVALELEEIARLDAPTAVRTRPGSTSLYVAERNGRVVELTGDALEPRDEPVLDISGEVSTDSERGFLGFDFSEDGSLVWTMHNDLSGDSVVTEWAVGDDGVVDPASRRELLTVDQPFSNHNGGDVHRGPDGMLWIGLGDGGGSGDPNGNGQNTSTLLGSILRIDPTPGDDLPYTIPPDNPFADGGGAPEIWAYGVRNPWRFSFDAATGDLWIGDVGESTIEEIDLLASSDGLGRGANLGWNVLEGDRPFTGSTAPPDHVPPVVVYDHTAGRCSVTGGHVYRGDAIPELRGVYIFGDFCDTVVRGYAPDAGVGPLTLAPVGASLISFGVDTNGEILVLGRDGVIRRLVAA